MGPMEDKIILYALSDPSMEFIDKYKSVLAMIKLIKEDEE
jgi:hypothetical protein